MPSEPASQETRPRRTGVGMYLDGERPFRCEHLEQVGDLSFEAFAHASSEHGARLLCDEIDERNSPVLEFDV